MFLTLACFHNLFTEEPSTERHELNCFFQSFSSFSTAIRLIMFSSLGNLILSPVALSLRLLLSHSPVIFTHVCWLVIFHNHVWIHKPNRYNISLGKNGSKRYPYHTHSLPHFISLSLSLEQVLCSQCRKREFVLDIGLGMVIAALHGIS